MASTVNAARSRLQNEYAPLRLAILDYYRLLPLVGRGAGAKAHQLPRKLGQWHHTHSTRVYETCPELIDTINAIEDLASQRDWQYIKGLHVKQRPGPKPAGQRVGPMNTHHEPELMGEWPPQWK